MNLVRYRFSILLYTRTDSRNCTAKMRWLNSSSALTVRILARPLGFEPKSDGFGDRRATNCTTSVYSCRFPTPTQRFRSRRCFRLIPKRNPPSGPLTFSYRRCIVLRPAVMGLYVERRCSTIREDTSETRTAPQPSRQGMPEPAGTQKRQRKSRWESNKKRDQPTAFLQSVSPIQTVIITQW